MANGEFGKALRVIERKIKMQEAFITKQIAKCELMKRNFNAMREFVASMPKSSKAGGAGIKRNLLPQIIDFVGKNPGCTIADVRKALATAEQTVRYHLKHNPTKFKAKKDDLGRTRISLSKRAEASNNFRTEENISVAS